ncbi:MAG: hypothetical protein A2Y40_09800 [Candidatus Margulisbacteria bacterium GWF2_35_9]|nr:MAG: hypothetical protein A2Y40_09800 [Candidatus Margulisbacteria bacterium GWF2_35_9]
MKALFVIDVQSDFIKDNSKLPTAIKNYIENTDYTLIVISYYKNTTSTSFYRYINCKEGLNNGPEIIVPELRSISKPHTIIEKITYSIFKTDTIMPLLIEHNINEIDFCGTDTDACVLASMFEGFDLGYKCNLLQDLTESGSMDLSTHESALKIIKRNIDPSVKSLES